MVGRGGWSVVGVRGEAADFSTRGCRINNFSGAAGSARQKHLKQTWPHIAVVVAVSFAACPFGR